MLQERIINQKIELERQLRFFIALNNSKHLSYKQASNTLISGNKSLILTIEKMQSGIINISEKMVEMIEEAIIKNKTLLSNDDILKEMKVE